MSKTPEDDPWNEPPNSRRNRLTAAFVASLVALVMEVPTREILARSRTNAAAARARQTAIYLVHIVLGWPLRQAAALYGRDRTTAGHAVQIIEDLRDDAAFDARLSSMEACLRQIADPSGAAT
jgi:chromosomal replication initiation ATPase DnaA